MKKILGSLVALSFGLAVNAQTINYGACPAQNQLYPREANDSADVVFAGMVSPTCDSMVIKMYANGVNTKNVRQKLTFGMAGAPFNLKFRVHADTVLYKFQVYLKTGTTPTLKNTIDSVVCGDVYLVNGQSNAVSSNGGTKKTDKFLRSFGKQNEWDVYNLADTTWGLAWNGAPGYFGVGAWEYEMMSQLKVKLGIPIAVINAAGSGSGIEAHKRNPTNPLNLTTGNAFYAKMLYKAQKAHVADKVKIILWHQGEADMGAGDFWFYNFRVLCTASWKTDYPALQQVYLYQIRQGCTTTDQSSGRIRELQRILSDSVPMCHVMSTVGIPGHDGCHFSPTGYQTMGQWMYRLVAHDFYGKDFGMEVAPPNPKKAFYSNDTRDEIAIVFRNGQNVVWVDSYSNGSTFYMNDYFYLNGKGSVVKSHRISNDTLFLGLKAPSTADKLTYLPDNFYLGTLTYEGPFIMGANGVGLFSFQNLPISCQNNTAPSITAATININQYATPGTAVDTVTGTDPENNKLYYSITAGNTDNAFVIDSVTGILKVLNPLIRYKYMLTMKVRDNGTCGLSATATWTINNKAYSLDNAFLNDLEIFPNPSNGAFDLILANDVSGDVIITVTDLAGRAIMSMVEAKGPTEMKKHIVLDAAQGVYLICVKQNDKAVTKKIVIE